MGERGQEGRKSEGKILCGEIGSENGRGMLWVKSVRQTFRGGKGRGACEGKKWEIIESIRENGLKWGR